MFSSFCFGKAPLKQINDRQIHALTKCLLAKVEENNEKMHKGTVVLSTGLTNLLPAIQQTRTGSKTLFRKIRSPGPRRPQYYFKFEEPIFVTAAREMQNKRATTNKCKKLLNWRKRNDKPRMVLFPYETEVVPELDIKNTELEEEDEDMTEAEVLQNILDGIINTIVRDNPPLKIKQQKIFLSRDAEIGKLYSFHSKQGKKLIASRLAKDQGLTGELIENMDIFELEVQIERFGAVPNEVVKSKKGRALKPKQLERKRLGLIDQLNAMMEKKADAFYNDHIMGRTMEIEKEIEIVKRPLKFRITGVCACTYEIHGRWHLALSLQSKREKEATDSDYTTVSERIDDRSERVPKDAYSLFTFLMLEALLMKYYIGSMVKKFELKLLFLGWNKWSHVLQTEVQMEEANQGCAQMLKTRMIKWNRRRKKRIQDGFPTPKYVTKHFPRHKYRFTYAMYRKLKSVSIVHASQFHYGIQSDLESHRFLKKTDVASSGGDLDFRLGREFYLNNDDSIEQLELAGVALPVVITKDRGWMCSRLFAKKKSGSIAASRNRNPATIAANKYLPGPLALMVESICAGTIFLTWMVCNAWKLPFYCYGMYAGFKYGGDHRKTRRQIQRINQKREKRKKATEWGASKRKEFSAARKSKRSKETESKYVVRKYETKEPEKVEEAPVEWVNEYP